MNKVDKVFLILAGMVMLFILGMVKL